MVLSHPDPGAWIPAFHKPPLISLGNGVGWGRGVLELAAWSVPQVPLLPCPVLSEALESPVWRVEGPWLIYNPWQMTCSELHGRSPAKPGKLGCVRPVSQMCSVFSKLIRKNGERISAAKVRGVGNSSLSAALTVFLLH